MVYWSAERPRPPTRVTPVAKTTEFTFDVVIIGSGPVGGGRSGEAKGLGGGAGEGGRHGVGGGGGIIGTGARPYQPADVDFNHPRIFDSDKNLKLDHTPQSITIYGAGVVGSEYTSMFRNLNVKVNLINTRSKLLEFLDHEIVDELSYHMRDQSALLRHNQEYASVT